MKSSILTRLLVGLAVTAAAPLLFPPKSAIASKMQPGMMAHSNIHGLNANTSCRRPRFNICQGCNVNIRMRVAAGQQCGFNFQSLGPFAGQEVVTSPRNGTYSSANETKSVYRPSGGYTGPDFFESRLFFQDGSGKRTFLNLRVNVLVVPSL